MIQPPRTDQEKTDWIQLIRTEGIGPVTFFKLVRKYHSAAEALKALPFFKHPPLSPSDREGAQRERDACHQKDIALVFYGEPAYPALFRELPDAPPVLSILGDVALLNRPAVGIVGGRNASLSGKKFAHALAQDLARNNFVVASGLARGIDTQAHLGALQKGTTVAVLAGGIDVVYPPENETLYKTIQEKGAVISEIALGTQPQAKHFPRRNRLISGLSNGVVVVEAALKSGSLITARFALEQGREVFSVPGSPLDPRCRGSNNLLRFGAVLTEGIEDVLQNLQHVSTFLPAPRLSPQAFKEDDIDLEDEVVPALDATNPRERLLENLGFTPIGVDELIRQCHISPQEAQAILLELELSGRLERHPDDRVSLLVA